MLPKVRTSGARLTMGLQLGAQGGSLERYRPLVGDDLIDELLGLAKALQGLRICHVNATGAGGGVAELLARHVPVLQALGLQADWRLIHGDPEFFTVTKAVHNALQGARYDLGARERGIFLEMNERSAKMLDPLYDVYVIHDPQPAALRSFAGRRDAKWIWRCHIDTSAPDPQVRDFLVPLVREYDALIFTMREFLLPGLEDRRLALIVPAIDPLATKNVDLPLDVCRRTMADSGIDINRPLLVQVSRFDPWKDPLGVIEAYRLVKREFPGVQLALVGAMASDDPEGWQMLDRVQAEAANDPDLFVFTNLTGVGNMEVNVFQQGAEVVIQKSLREGFGLVVSEALWKETPVVAGRAGGIPMQFPAGFERYLVDSIPACAAETLHLLRHPGARGDLGRAGREHVRQHFLLPRLVRDELRLIRELVQA
jgi:trehalose synthase